jgi:hypothetical protein
MTVQRDWGNRNVRKNARLKYTIERYGLKVPPPTVTFQPITLPFLSRIAMKPRSWA